MNKFLILLCNILLLQAYTPKLYAKRIKLQPLVVIQINQLLDLSVEKFYTESLQAKAVFKGSSVIEMQKLTKILLKSSKLLPVETAVHFTKIFHTLEVQLSLLLKTLKPMYIKQVWKSLFVISRSFNVKVYLYGFCSRDKSMWLQKKKTKLVNPVGVKSCVSSI